MGGIGKTTIASAIYRKLATQFSFNSIILNVQQEIERFGLHHIQSKYRFELLGENNTSSGLCLSFDQRLKWTKALLVLDDVNNSDQLRDLIGKLSKFAPGSRIIVTSRDMQVLKNVKADGIYEVKEMNFHESLRLFCLNAFKQSYPLEGYVGLSENILNYAKRVPLALKVLGFLLCGRPKEAWESQLQKLDKLPENDIFEVLKLSYVELDEEQNEIFLDIACFYRGHLENVVLQTLDSCGFSSLIGIEVLKDRGLISIVESRIVMHDLIQEMGHEIVHQQCVNDPGKRSRLWKHREIYKVLRNNKGTDAIRCILLDICKIEKVQLHAETFKKMDNLRMMLFYKPYGVSKESNVILPAFLESLPDDLKFLRWDGFPQKSLPEDFFPDNLVKLYMPHSHLKQLWQRDKNLIQIPDLVNAQILKK
ncbi:putative winged helix-turn-helix DNA-binding domain-containing protein [Medicago truncatula]|uniref:Putative winged helix-turn-helix DNA-binding domain-containing protein n=1 Tax=Medicago truncatula TaxID=3880 RepID=A0A396GYB0_MEDTR|nr:disease resistance-like protein DSC1 [Medicago truncatula]XP_024627558.1 disease resistance-like protein DSC1 [Medicago truncatula]XP_039685542.1 disease resistance-like protein DSC1 [Medicago truncatula]RHN43825.1 putative winged helix-turn-helix DNA-binding domain-containing protein [Medicago truncatula]